MTLAAILSLSFFVLSGSGAGGPAFGSLPSLREPATQDQNNPPAAQAKPAPTTNPQAAPPTSSSQPENSPAPAEKRSHHKKPGTPDCSPSPAPLKPPGNAPSNAPNGTAGSTSPGSGTGHSSPPASANAKNPCAPPKVVVKDGGSDEPTIELTHGTSEQQASQQRYTTEQLRTATEDNLKKLSGRQLTASQQEIVTQIKQFMDQAKSAVADQDLERGHSLAMKAHLLSEELIKP
ncbi:MAG: hypothetical protein WBV55_07130 [Candidatus Sulfotelmatobacter sp.]